jgi:hypothetical protein
MRSVEVVIVSLRGFGFWISGFGDVLTLSARGRRHGGEVYPATG